MDECKPLHEGLHKICQYLCKRVTEQSNQDGVLSAQKTASEDGGRCATLLSELFQSVVSCIEQHSDDLVGTFGSDALETLIRSLNKECDIRGSQLLKRYLDCRNIFQTGKEDGSLQTRNPDSEASAVDPRQGLTLAHFSAQLEPCLTHERTPHTLNTPLTRASQSPRTPPIPDKALKLS